MKQLGLAALGLALAAGCHNAPCYDAAFADGERFQFTVLGVQKTLLATASVHPSPCDALPLAAGGTFILVGGASYDDGGSLRDCVGRSARPDIPSFAAGVVTSCMAASEVLGLTCTSETSTTCGVAFGTNLLAGIEPDTTLLSSARLDIGVHDSCTGAGCDLDLTVRVERLPP